MRYTYNERTVFVDPAGNVVTAESIRGNPVTVTYTKEGDAMIATRVVISKPAAGAVVERKESSTHIERE